MKKKFSNVLYFIFLVLLVGIVVFCIVRSIHQNSNSNPVSDNTTAVDIVRPLPVSEGKQHYSLSNVHHSPNFTDAWIDPELVKPGMQQTMTVHITDVHAITKVTATIKSDTETQTYELTLSSGTTLDGEWSGTWTVNDTHEKVYVTDFLAFNDINEQGEAHLSWSDPNIGCNTCGTDATCTGGTLTGGADGADGGALVINGAITIPNGQTLVYGTSMKINAAVAINSGAQIKQGYITMNDSDADTYPSSLTDSYSSTASPAAPARRRSTASGTNCFSLDCNDSSNAMYPGITCSTGSWSSCSRTGYNCTGSQSRSVSVCSGATGSCVAHSENQSCNMADGTQCSDWGSCTDNRTIPSYSCTGIQYVSTCSSGSCSGTTSQSCSLGSATTVYRDSDSDGYGGGTAVSGCTGKGYITAGGDCCDSDNRARPNQTSCYTSANNCGNYDYNCSGSTSVCGGCSYATGIRFYCHNECSNEYYRAESPDSSNCGQTGYNATQSKECEDIYQECVDDSYSPRTLVAGTSCTISCQ